MATAAIYVWNSQNPASNNRGIGTQTRNCHVNVGAAGPDWMNCATAIPSNVHRAESETPVSDSIGERRFYGPVLMNFSDVTASQQIVEV